MFASKTPRDLNHDPMPWRNPVGNSRLDRQLHPGWWHDARPEFDHVQHAEPNPILVEFRAASDGDMRGWHMWLVLAREEMLSDGRCTLEHYHHAVRVLARLADMARLASLR